MVSKMELVKECIDIMRDPHVLDWYEQNFEGKNQYDSINTLEAAVNIGELTVRQALSLALIVGVQWNVNFEKDKK